MWLPGWDSVGSSGWWVTFWAWSCIACLFASAATQLAYQVYSARNTELIEISTRADATQKQKEKQESEAKYSAEIGGLKGQLSEAEKKVAKLQDWQKPRSLTPNQKATLVRVISIFKGQQAMVSVISGDTEGASFANELLDAFKTAGWHVGDGIHHVIYDRNPDGLQIHVNPSDIVPAGGDRGFIFPAANALFNVLKDFGALLPEDIRKSSNVSPKSINVIVGPKRPVL